MSMERYYKNMTGNMEDDIDIFHYAMRVLAYWKRIILISLISGLVAYNHYHSIHKVQIPSSQMQVTLGFQSIVNGVYPNGSIFNKNNLLEEEILKKAYNRLVDTSPETAISFESFKGSFSARAIYPLEIQLAKSGIRGDTSAFKEKTFDYYEKLRRFNPSQYIIRFAPNVALSNQSKDIIFDSIVNAYSETALTKRYPTFLSKVSLIKIDLENNPLPIIHDVLLNHHLNVSNFLELLSDKVKTPYKLEAGIDPLKDAHSNIGNLPRIGGIASHIVDISTIQNRLAMLESLIYEKKILKNPKLFIASQRTLQKRLKAEINMLEKQRNFRIKLAGLSVIRAKLDKQGLIGKDESRPNEAPRPTSGPFLTSPKVVNILLRYSERYYTLLTQATALHDKKTTIEKELAITQDRLKAFTDSPNLHKKELEEAVQKAKQLALSIQNSLNNVVTAVNEKTVRYYREFEPPIAKAVYLHGSPTPFNPRKVKVVIAAAFFITTILVLLYASFSEWKARRDEEDTSPTTAMDKTT